MPPVLGGSAKRDEVLEQLESLRRVRRAEVVDAERLELGGGQLGHLLDHADTRSVRAARVP